MSANIAALSLLAFFWGGFATPVAIGLARRFLILDAPGGRKKHTTTVPRGAGLCLWLGYMFLALSANMNLFPQIRPIATGATLVFLIGYLDDIRSLSPSVRLLTHSAAAGIALLGLPLSPATFIVAWIWVTGMTSAYNFVDGVNGLCLTLSVVSCLILSATGASYVGYPMTAMAIGVFCWNFPSAQTFLGDGGSTLLGFIVGVHIIDSTSSVLNSADLHVKLLLLVLLGGLPLADTAFVFVRRILGGFSPFTPDRSHLHHLLERLRFNAFWTDSTLSALHAAILFIGLLALRQLR
jgi:UDP-GlcNAc:undecaprenyl-phosphate GlcNAc-1-phosphate transferase